MASIVRSFAGVFLLAFLWAGTGYCPQAPAAEKQVITDTMGRQVELNKDIKKIIAIPFGDPTYNHYTDISQLPAHISEEMNHFFTVYKQLENKETIINEVGGREMAKEIIARAITSYVDTFCK